MSRTVHHVPASRRHITRNPDGGYWSRHQIDSLRYSALIEAQADRLVRRPRPERATHIRTFHRLPRATGNREFANYRHTSARRNRRRNRTALRQMMRELDAVAVRYGAEAAADAAHVAMPVQTHPVRDADWQVW
ncbi:hypothetical protein MSAS_23870 [Mycobacterium saskatchewanense]|nr:hypothetical protein MSAS_23870 [Mycobacterium saskatchewanense]